MLLQKGKYYQIYFKNGQNLSGTFDRYLPESDFYLFQETKFGSMVIRLEDIKVITA